MVTMSDSSPIAGLGNGTLRPIVGHHFQVEFILHDQQMVMLTKQVTSCDIDILSQTLTLRFDLTLCCDKLDNEIQQLVDNPTNSTRINIQHYDHAEIECKLVSFNQLVMTRCQYKLDYCNNDLVTCDIEFKYSQYDINVIGRD